MQTESLYWDVANENFCIWDWNIETGSIGISSNWLKILGIEPYEFVPTSRWFNELIHPEDLPIVLFKLESNLNGNILDDSFFFRLRNRYGQYLNFRSKGMIVLQDPQGSPAHVVWACDWIS